MKTKHKNGKVVETLQVYIDPENKAWLKKAAAKHGFKTTTKFLDYMLSMIRVTGSFVTRS